MTTNNMIEPLTAALKSPSNIRLLVETSSISADTFPIYSTKKPS